MFRCVVFGLSFGFLVVLFRYLLPPSPSMLCAFCGVCVAWHGVSPLPHLHTTPHKTLTPTLPPCRIEAFGRPVKTAMLKKLEEGVFSDLRNLKPGMDASPEEPKVCPSLLDVWLCCFVPPFF
jgi:hypothetical protein